MRTPCQPHVQPHVDPMWTPCSIFCPTIAQKHGVDMGSSTSYMSFSDRGTTSTPCQPHVTPCQPHLKSMLQKFDYVNFSICRRLLTHLNASSYQKNCGGPHVDPMSTPCRHSRLSHDLEIEENLQKLLCRSHPGFVFCNMRTLRSLKHVKRRHGVDMTTI